MFERGMLPSPRLSRSAGSTDPRVAEVEITLVLKSDSRGGRFSGQSGDHRNPPLQPRGTRAPRDSFFEAENRGFCCVIFCPHPAASGRRDAASNLVDGSVRVPTSRENEPRLRSSPSSQVQVDKRLWASANWESVTDPDRALLSHIGSHTNREAPSPLGCMAGLLLLELSPHPEVG